MSTNFELNTKPREVFGTTASRRLRRSDQVPAMIYGADQNNEAVLLDHHEIMRNLEVEAFHSAIISLNTESGSQQVVLREVQRHRVRPRLVHVDFQRIKATEKLHMKIPLHFEGVDEAPGVKVDEGIFSPLMTELDITCLPKDLPTLGNPTIPQRNPIQPSILFGPLCSSFITRSQSPAAMSSNNPAER